MPEVQVKGGLVSKKGNFLQTFLPMLLTIEITNVPGFYPNAKIVHLLIEDI